MQLREASRRRETMKQWNVRQKSCFAASCLSPKKRTCLWRVAKPTKPQNKAPTNTLTLVLKTRVLPSGYEVLFPSLIYRLLRPLRNVYSWLFYIYILNVVVVWFLINNLDCRLLLFQTILGVRTCFYGTPSMHVIRLPLAAFTVGRNTAVSTSKTCSYFLKEFPPIYIYDLFSTLALFFYFFIFFNTENLDKTHARVLLVAWLTGEWIVSYRTQDTILYKQE